MKNYFLLLFLIATMSFNFGCGKSKNGGGDGDKKGSDAKGENCEDSDAEGCLNFKVRSGDALALHFSSVFGPESVVNVNDSSENLIEKYQMQFGGTADKKIGNTTSDEVNSGNPMTSYFTVLSIVAMNAGIYCGVSEDPRCSCESVDAAKEMLNRSVSFTAFDAKNPLVLKLAESCKSSRKNAITALASSLAFVKK